MPVDSKTLGYLAVGLSTAVLLGYIGYNVNQSGMQPPKEFADASLNEQLDFLTQDNFFHPHDCVNDQNMVFTRHRYPNVSGGNISTLIHHGMSALNKPAPQDSGWMERPPGEVMW